MTRVVDSCRLRTNGLGHDGFFFVLETTMSNRKIMAGNLRALLISVSVSNKILSRVPSGKVYSRIISNRLCRVHLGKAQQIIFKNGFA